MMRRRNSTLQVLRQSRISTNFQLVYLSTIYHGKWLNRFEYIRTFQPKEDVSSFVKVFKSTVATKEAKEVRMLVAKSYELSLSSGSWTWPNLRPALRRRVSILNRNAVGNIARDAGPFGVLIQTARVLRVGGRGTVSLALYLIRGF